ncbi:MAG: SRPBCC family protein [Saprospiraceae bacterium]|nr:SRPBCC family protein [Saprospiraceae bacterium]
MECSSSQDISKPPSEIFPFLYAWENLPLWITEFKRFEPLTGEEGEIGSTSWVHLTYGSYSFKMKQEIINYVDDQTLDIIWSNSILQMHRSFDVTEEAAGQSKLQSQLVLMPRSFWGSLCLPFLAKTIRKYQIRNMERLKDALEVVIMS